MTVDVSSGGLGALSELYQDRFGRARDLSARGNKFVGHYCCYPPPELMTAAGVIPYRLVGDPKEQLTLVDTCLDPVACPYVRNIFDLALKGKFDFLDGVAVPHSCDNVQRMDIYWRYYKKMDSPRLHYINMPHVVTPDSLIFFKSELTRFRHGLERLTGRSISDDGLRTSIRLHNDSRAMLRKLNSMKTQDHPLLSGVEMMQIAIAGTRTPVNEYNSLLTLALKEIASRQTTPPKKEARLLVTGSELDDVAFIKLLEDNGANVVTDDLCTGTRLYADDVPTTDDPLDGLARHYLDQLKCPRTYREGLEARFGHVGEFARDFNVNGVVVYVLTYCDTIELDVPDLKDYLKKQGIPVLVIEDDYTMAASGQMKTRIQAFVEMISAGRER